MTQRKRRGRKLSQRRAWNARAAAAAAIISGQCRAAYAASKKPRGTRRATWLGGCTKQSAAWNHNVARGSAKLCCVRGRTAPMRGASACIKGTMRTLETGASRTGTAEVPAAAAIGPRALLGLQVQTAAKVYGLVLAHTRSQTQARDNGNGVDKNGMLRQRGAGKCTKVDELATDLLRQINKRQRSDINIREVQMRSKGANSKRTSLFTTRSEISSKGNRIGDSIIKPVGNIINRTQPTLSGVPIRRSTRSKRIVRCSDSSLLSVAASLAPVSTSIMEPAIGGSSMPTGASCSSATSNTIGWSLPASTVAHQFSSDQAKIQTIIDRLRQKTERARMSSNSSEALSLRIGQQLVEHSQKSSSNCVAENEMDLIKAASRAHRWQWSDQSKSHECVISEDKLSLCFHPQCSESAAACRGSEPLVKNGNYYYWEIHVQDKIYGTSVMFGLCTEEQRLHANEYCNLIGLDEAGWSLSHKGLAWHGGKSRQFTKMFPTNQPITIGLLYNTMRGELSYFMDGKNLGVAFRGLNNIEADLYPVVGSTAKCTRMRLLGSYCGFRTLFERSCFTLLKSAKDRFDLLNYSKQNQLPKALIDYLAQAANICQDNQTSCTTATSSGQEAASTVAQDNFQSLMSCSNGGATDATT